MTKIYPLSVSVVIPCYNEQNRLSRAIKICHQFARRFPDWEFIFVNDGSTDKTAQLIKKTGFKLVSYSSNHGKGYALKQGVKKAVKKLILLCDVDFSTPLTELPKLCTDADVTIGSRKTSGAKILKHQPCWREWLGKQFTNLTNLWLGTKVSDVTCGFKLFKTQVAKKLFSLSTINRWGYDAEILFLAKKLGLEVIAVPVIWKNDAKTKVSLIKDILRSFHDLWIIRWHQYEV